MVTYFSKQFEMNACGNTPLFLWKKIIIFLIYYYLLDLAVAMFTFAWTWDLLYLRPKYLYFQPKYIKQHL